MAKRLRHRRFQLLFMLPLNDGYEDGYEVAKSTTFTRRSGYILSVDLYIRTRGMDQAYSLLRQDEVGLVGEVWMTCVLLAHF